MINWSNNGGAFISARELDHLLIHLEKMGLIGEHMVMFEGFGDYEEDISLSFSEGTIESGDWLKDVLNETDEISPAGFSYPLSRTQQSNANSGYQSGTQDRRAGIYFVDMFKDLIQEEVYEFGLRITLNGITIKSAYGGVDSEETDEGYQKAGTWAWNIKIDPNSITKEVDE